MVATDIAEELARRGTPFHQAHKLAGKLVLHSINEGKKPSEWTAEELEKFAPEFAGDFVRLMNPVEGMKTREIPGGTGPGVVAQALVTAQERLNSLKNYRS